MSYLCGCYYYIGLPAAYIRREKQYLPLVDSEVHSTILSETSRTILKQTFTNPSPKDNIKECIYTFPLYDGVSVVSFTCRIGEKVLKGLVKEKAKAKEVYDKAVARGETAGLLEQAPEASDVFSTKLGNILAGQNVIVEIEYIGELKHQDDGTRFTIPTKIAPRYGSAPSLVSSIFSSPAKDAGGIKITVDISLPEGSFIKGVQSPSHPIAVSLGTLSGSSNADPTMSKASATLSLGSAALEKDFVLIVQSKDTGIPKAILETHPTIPHHRALMATLVPKFSLPPSRPEIVFVADRSGSMSGNIADLVSAMKVFLKSMPAGVKFNICSFGSSYRFLWPKSKTYGKDTLDEATNHLATFAADMGGTETFRAIEATIDQRFTDIPLEIMLLTDGDIWQQEQLFTYLNKQVELSKGNIRVFPLGIGNGVSHSLINGLARAGNGFSQTVQIGERLDNAVVKMLRGALTPHITDHTLEVKYEQEDDDFELIDTVTDGMKVLLSSEDKKSEPKATISLFDTNVDPEKDNIKDAKVSLPNIPIPKLLQAPHKIPSLFAFSRATVYLLLSPSTVQRNPTAVILRATSTHGPLALEIPIEVLATPGQTIHQLAAKKAVQDLEEGRGWIYDAKDQSGTLVRDKFPSCFDDLVQREAVRLGEKFQVAGKWCSFVAVAENDKEIAEKEKGAQPPAYDGKFERSSVAKSKWQFEADEDDGLSSEGDENLGANRFMRCGSDSDEDDKALKDGKADIDDFAEGDEVDGCSFELMEDASPVVAQEQKMSATYVPGYDSVGSSVRRQRMSQPLSASPTGGAQPEARGFARGLLSGRGGSLFGSVAPQQQAQQQHFPSFGAPKPFSAPAPYHPAAYASASAGSKFGGLHAGRRTPPPGAYGIPQSGGASFAPPPPPGAPNTMAVDSLVSMADTSSSTTPMYRMAATTPAPSASSNQFSGFLRRKSGASAPSPGSSKSAKEKKAHSPIRSFEEHTPPAKNWTAASTSEKVFALIELQDFEGFWASEGGILGFTIPEKEGVEKNVWITLVVIRFLESQCADEEGIWGLVVEKARGWLEGLGLMNLEALEKEAGVLVKA